MIGNIIFFIFCILEIYSYDYVHEVAFPILDENHYPFTYQLLKDEKNNKFSVENDVEHVRYVTDDDLLTDLKNYDNVEKLRALDFIGLVEKYPGYTAEEHHVITEDGYNITLHRISGSPQNPKRKSKQVVLIQHALFLSSDAYVLLGPGKDLAFRLSEQNYDVWIANARGNTYSKSHLNKYIDNKNFWDFSFHEIGKYDMSATIDYILEETEEKSLKLIGYTIGATEAYILLSELPEYNKKVDLLVGVAPFTYWENSKLKQQLDAESYSDIIAKLDSSSSTGEIYTQSSFMQYLWYNYCRPENNNVINVCQEILMSFFGGIDRDLNEDNLKKIMRHVPGGTSMKTLTHLLQNIKSGEFSKYDYGKNTTMNYDLSKITTANAVFTGHIEFFVKKKDVKELFKRSSNIAIHSLQSTEGEKLSNIEFLWGNNVKQLNDAIIDLF